MVMSKAMLGTFRLDYLSSLIKSGQSSNRGHGTFKQPVPIFSFPRCGPGSPVADSVGEKKTGKKVIRNAVSSGKQAAPGAKPKNQVSASEVRYT
jgi:hypothetical protein